MAERLDAGEIRIRGSKRDHARLTRLARSYEMNASALLRRLIADAYRVRFPARRSDTKKGQ
jgi:hypothetical protein